jgi:hypothetical protein
MQSMSNSEKKRQQRQLQQSASQSSQDRAAYKANRSQYQLERDHAEAVVFVSKSIAWFVGISLLVGFFWYMSDQDAKRAAEYDKLVQAKYAKWITYRDQNCESFEKLFGVVVRDGKFSSNDNATKYSCKNGMIYTISENAELAINRNDGNLDHIPDPSKDEN